MDDTLLALLRSADTSTVCTAIEVAEGRRGFARFTRGRVVASRPEAPPMVGYACTARIAPTRPPAEPPTTIRERRMAYYRAMAEAPKPAITVIEDADWLDCIGVYWGEINTTVHKALGLAGALTNGVMRDLGDLPDDFPVVAGSVGPSHGFVHVQAIHVPVTIFGLTIAPGELVHADRHGAVVIPPEVVPELAGAFAKLRASERVILEPARSGFPNFASFEAAWARFEASRT